MQRENRCNVNQTHTRIIIEGFTYSCVSLVDVLSGDTEIQQHDTNRKQQVYLTEIKHDLPNNVTLSPNDSI